MGDAQQIADGILERASIAAGIFSQLNQEETDRIVEAVCRAALDARIKLARMAVEETGIGIWQHKVIKNTLAAELVFEDIRDQKTVGVIARDEQRGIVEIAQPLGPIVAVIPVTNPTATVIFKALIALKSQNPIIFSPHRGAPKCSTEAARICYEAALSADAPEDCIQWVPESSRELTHALMSDARTALVLATGGPSLVKAAYSSGTPAIGVGSGNVPVFIERSADIPFAVENILLSKTFDNGTVCASEQAIVVERAIADEARSAFEKQGAFFLDPDAVKKLEAVVIRPETGLMSPKIVGRSVAAVAELAGITVPDGTRCLMAPQQKIGADDPLSGEILAPILAWYECDDFDDALKHCIALNYRGGIGHTASIYSTDEEKISAFGRLMDAGRVVVNTPSSQGGVGGVFNQLHTSLTLGCGSGGKNITAENITARHLINVKKLCYRKPNERWLAIADDRLLDETLSADDIINAYRG